jgi:hypothetical protein
MSAVCIIERVNIDAQWIDTHLRINNASSSVVDQREPALGRNQLDDLLEVIGRVSGGEHESGRADAQRCDLLGSRLAMVDDVMNAEILDPAPRLRARGSRHHSEIGERADELDRDRADAASAPIMRTAGAAPTTSLWMSMRSNRASHAVIDVSGSAAASANPSERGSRPTMRSSTR